jgi:hypothetical protein
MRSPPGPARERCEVACADGPPAASLAGCRGLSGRFPRLPCLGRKVPLIPRCRNLRHPTGSAERLTLTCQKTQRIGSIASPGCRGRATYLRLSRRSPRLQSEPPRREIPRYSGGLRTRIAGARRLTPKGRGVDSKRFGISIGSASFSIPLQGAMAPSSLLRLALPRHRQRRARGRDGGLGVESNADRELDASAAPAPGSEPAGPSIAAFSLHFFTSWKISSHTARAVSKGNETESVSGRGTRFARLLFPSGTPMGVVPMSEERAV